MQLNFAPKNIIKIQKNRKTHSLISNILDFASKNITNKSKKFPDSFAHVKHTGFCPKKYNK